MMNTKAFFDKEANDIVLTENHRKVATMTQIQQVVRQATVEHGLQPNKGFGYHLFEVLYQFNRKESINFLMVGVGDVFFELPREVALSLVGKYFLGDYTKRLKHHAN
jgi:hypothetical protein